MHWKRAVIIAGVGLAVLALFGYLNVFGPDSVVYRGKIREGNAVIAQIEAFRSEHHKLPVSMEEAGALQADPKRIYYEPCNDHMYLVWFGTTLGESMTYDSSSANWQSLNTTCGNAQ